MKNKMTQEKYTNFLYEICKIAVKATRKLWKDLDKKKVNFTSEPVDDKAYLTNVFLTLLKLKPTQQSLQKN